MDGQDGSKLLEWSGSMQNAGTKMSGDASSEIVDNLIENLSPRSKQ